MSDKRSGGVGAKEVISLAPENVALAGTSEPEEKRMALREIRDPVHGFVRLDTTDCKLVDTAPFQRLRRIHQLALASMVYPGALHTRFEHSLGVFHIASAICDRLNIEGDRKRLIEHAALLHDIGHGPFSHVSEIPLARYSLERSEAAGGRIEKIHEEVTAAIIEHHPQLAQVMSCDERERVASLVRGDGEYDDPVARSIISGPLDADKQDYLLRDSQMCGVQYGVYDIDRLHQSLTVVPDPAEGDALGVEPDGVQVVEQFLMAKYYITSQVYAHRVRLITDQMLVRAIVLGIEADEIEELRSLYTFDGTPEFVMRYTNWDDYRFLTQFADDGASGGYCAKLLNALKCRKLHKQVFDDDLSTYEDHSAVLMDAPDSVRAGVEERAAEIIGEHTRNHVDPREVIFYAYRPKAVRASSDNDMDGVLVATEPIPLPFGQCSGFYQSQEAVQPEARIVIFAPVEYGTEHQRDRLRRNMREPLRAAILEAAVEVAEGECQE